MPAPWIALHPKKNTTYDDGRTTFDDVPRLCIDPVECIDCDACVPSAPSRRFLHWMTCPRSGSSIHRHKCRVGLFCLRFHGASVGRSGIEAFLLPLRSILCLLHRDLVDM